jgi:arylsulfatase A-like enzyme/Flp pilus assembly protein TadD
MTRPALGRVQAVHMTDVIDARPLRRLLNLAPTRSISWLGLMAMLVVAAITGCGRGAAPPADLSLLLVTLDTTRADAVGCYGGSEAKTPNLDRLAGEGVRFDRCTACTPLTASSHSTILTGTWPMIHKVRANGTGKLPDSATTVAETLLAQGFATRAVVASFVVKRMFGLAQGFEVYDDRMPLAAPRTPALERPANLVAEAAINNLRDVAGARFFMWVHFYDAHHPYLSTTGNGPDSREAYMEEIELVDRQLGRILAVLDGLGITDTTAVVVVSDHGEGLGDHGEFDHGFFLYETTQHVPLIIKVPGWTPAGGVVSTRVRTVDLAPTLLELTGVTPLEIMQGKSLVTMLADPEAGADRVAYSEAWQAHDAFGMAPLRGLYDGGWKLVNAPEPVLIDLSADLGETENVARAHPDRVAAMQQTLGEFLSVGASGGTGERLAITDETAAALDALGYSAVDGDAVQGDASTTTKADENPLRHMKAIEKYALASRVMTTNPERAKRLFAEVVFANPDAPGPFFRQMRLLMTKRADDGRIGFCREVIAARPDSKLPRLHLAQLLARGGRYDDGIGELELLLIRAPEYAAGHLELSRVLLGVGDAERARDHLETARRLVPRDVAVLIALARLDSSEGDLDSAVAILETASLIDPASSAVRSELAHARRVLGEGPGRH